MGFRFEFEKVIDLSYPVDENAPREKPIGPPKIYDTATIEKDGYFEGRVDISGHCSTHMDTPSLMYANGITVERVPVERLVGKAFRMKFPQAKPGYEISKADIEAWLKKNGDLPQGSIVFLSTGMQPYWKDNQEEFMTNWVGLSGEAAKFLVSKGIKVVGTDACNIDSINGPKLNFPAHHILLENGILIVEDLYNLDQLPTSFWVVIAPLKLCKSSGAPARVLAFV